MTTHTTLSRLAIGLAVAMVAATLPGAPPATAAEGHAKTKTKTTVTSSSASSKGSGKSTSRSSTSTKIERHDSSGGGHSHTSLGTTRLHTDRSTPRSSHHDRYPTTTVYRETDHHRHTARGYRTWRHHHHRPRHGAIYWGYPWWVYWRYDDIWYDYYGWYRPYWSSYRIYYGPDPWVDDCGYVETNVTPEEAEVYVDGGYSGVADDFDGWPGPLCLDPGRHELMFRAPGYRTLTVELYASRGRTIDLEYDLRPGHGSERLTRGAPPVYDDDEPIYDYDDIDGPPRYRKPYRSDETRRDRFQKSRPPRPAPEPAFGDDLPEDVRRMGALRLRIDREGAAIYVDGEFWGSAPANTWGYIYLEPGEHRIEVLLPGYQTYRKELSIEQGEEQSLSIELRK